MSRVQESGFAAAAAAAIGNAESYCLRWNTFNTFVAKGLGSLLEEDEFTDVTLASEGQFLRAHKMLLSMCSPFFKRLFKANEGYKNGLSNTIVILNNVRFQDLEHIVQFVYHGKVNVSQGNLDSFFRTAELLQIEGLAEPEDQKIGFNNEPPDVTSPTGPIHHSLPTPAIPPPVTNRPVSKNTRWNKTNLNNTTSTTKHKLTGANKKRKLTKPTPTSESRLGSGLSRQHSHEIPRSPNLSDSARLVKDELEDYYENGDEMYETSNVIEHEEGYAGSFLQPEQDDEFEGFAHGEDSGGDITNLEEGLEEGFMNDGDGAPEEEAQAATTSRVRKASLTAKRKKLGSRAHLIRRNDGKAFKRRASDSTKLRSCPYCKETLYRSNLSRHICQSHSDVLIQQGKTVFKCEHCSYFYRTRASLENHLRNYHHLG